MKKKAWLISLILVIGMALSACKSTTPPLDILTQKSTSEDKVNVTVLVKYAFVINSFEKALELKFPNINLIQVGNYTADMGIEEYKARLKNDDLTDIVMTWPLDVGMGYLGERLMDLSTLSITRKYTTKSLNNIAYGTEGKLYYLPGPSQVRGIVYNQTLFKENGWTVPQDLDQFIALCKTIEKTGIRSLQLGLANGEVLDTAFMGYSFADCFASPDSAKALEDYNNGKGSIEDHYLSAFETFKRLADEGVFKKEDLNISYADRENMLYNRQCAMAEDSVLLARMAEEASPNGDQYAVMPFFNEGLYNDWSRLYPVCYIGLNKHLEQAEKSKYDAVMDIVDFISTPEGQKAMSADTGAMFSNLKGVAPPNVEEIDDLITSLNAGRYGIFPTFKNAQNALREGLADILRGDSTISEVIKKVDEQNLIESKASQPEVYGQASEDFTTLETGLFVTDAMKKYAQTDIALFLDNGKDGLFNGKGISAKFYEGDISEVDIHKRILPDVKFNEKIELWRITMSGENLIETLEKSIPINGSYGNWFYYFSGLKMEFSPTAEPGKRIKKITDDKGKDIDPNKLYSIAVMDQTVKDEFIVDCVKSNMLISTILKDEIKAQQTIKPIRDGRFVIVK